MLEVLCAECDNFVLVHKLEGHIVAEHPLQGIIELVSWPDGSLVMRLENELEMFFCE